MDREGNSNGAGLTKESLDGAEVAIEFSEPGAAAQISSDLPPLGVNIVCGTTGWHAELPRVREAVERAGVALVWSRNFSIGVNLFTRLVE